MPESAPIPLALIAAVSTNNVIGVENRLPWRLKGDLKYFKEMTLGKPVVMGRRTWESIGAKPLPGRTNIVVTHKKDYRAHGGVVCHSLDAAIEQARLIAVADGAPEVMVIGGELLFATALKTAHRLYLTEVHASPEGDAFFPTFDRAEWREVSRRDVPALEVEVDPAPAHSFVVLERA
ncbi:MULTISPECIES: dihydrofolate reductase [Nitrospirillum]|uniref:Dihydrofolate reductase n=1 Tax=Nitrospirillum amazonense TaxID=28077 RepID=A0A560FZD4_9PROT|nr:dihydrofolate reductase [Nitrospirillum amazonense]MEC4592401.1 dihydrofolate reductase [Nitrospirillum amazonense]TWB26921.1 dihydrofolate reductase [Nitrospirillum amazonense]